MKALFCLYSIVLYPLFLYAQADTAQARFFIWEDGRYGCIDVRGNVVIPPQYYNVDEFSEGLAAVRAAGGYGFINTDGYMMIAPQFEYAESFYEGFAKVYADGKPYFINREGKKAFTFDYAQASNFDNGRAIVSTASSKKGMIDTTGRLVIDTAFKYTFTFHEGLAVVHGLNYNPHIGGDDAKPRCYEVGVIDSNGKMIVPYGRYMYINAFIEGYASVTTLAQPWDTTSLGMTSKSGFIDKEGHFLLFKKPRPDSLKKPRYRCGLATVEILRRIEPLDREARSEPELDHIAFMNEKGEIVIEDTNYISHSGFAEDRCFVRTRQGKYSLINTTGKVLADNAYDWIESSFKKGKAVVRIKEKCGIIDKEANYIVPPIYDITDWDEEQEFFYFRQPDSNAVYKDDEERKRYNYGIIRRDGRVILPPLMSRYNNYHFIDGLQSCIIGGKRSYVNTEGVIVWKERKDTSLYPMVMNIDCMNNGYFLVRPKEQKRAYDGKLLKANPPGVIQSKDSFPANSLSLMVEPEHRDTINHYFWAHRVYLANSLAEQREFLTRDCLLNMKVQALDAHGRWRDIEKQHDWSYEKDTVLSLKAGEYWTFRTPAYEGDFRTKLRLALHYIDPAGGTLAEGNRKELLLYSNEYVGSINLAQFWRHSGYQSIDGPEPY